MRVSVVPPVMSAAIDGPLRDDGVEGDQAVVGGVEQVGREVVDDLEVVGELAQVGAHQRQLAA